MREDVISQSEDTNLTWWIKIDIFKSDAPNLASSHYRVDDEYRRSLRSLIQRPPFSVLPLTICRNGSLILRPAQEDVYLTQKLNDYFEGDAWWFRSIEILRDSNGRESGFLLAANGNQVQKLRFTRKQD